MSHVYDPNALKIYTDGSCMPNPGIGGIGLVIEFPDNLSFDNTEISAGYKDSTNNRMELLACIRALQWFQDNNHKLKLGRLIIITDSSYVYSNYSNAQYWKDNAWIDSNGKPYENKDLWDTFLKERQKVRAHSEIKWEKGKTRPILLRVDALAKDGAKHPLNIDSGYQAGKFTSTRTASKKGATLYPANADTITIRVYRKNVYGKNDKELHKITFDLYDKAEQKYTGKYVAYKNKDTGLLERNNCYEVVMNDNPKFPLILEAREIEYLK